MTPDNEVVLVRHGETEWSRSGKHTGRTDVPLTDLGRLQADLLAEKLRDRSFVLVMSSPLQRALETCERAGLAERAELSDDLLEWDYGDYEATTTADTRREIPGWTVWTHPILGGESVEMVGQRADVIIARVLSTAGDSVLFSHGHFLRILCARWLGLSADSGRLFGLDTATTSVLGFERETHVIRHWNEDCHLRSLDEAS